MSQPGWQREVLADIGAAAEASPAAATDTPAPPVVPPVVGRAMVHHPGAGATPPPAAPALTAAPAPPAPLLPPLPPPPATILLPPPSAAPAPPPRSTGVAPVAPPLPPATGVAPVAPPLPARAAPGPPPGPTRALPTLAPQPPSAPLAPRPAPAPGTAPAMASLIGRHPNGDTLRGGLTRRARRLLGATASAEAYRLTDDLRQVVQPVTTCRRILVTAVRGGAGATTLAALLGLAYAGHRHERTLTMDVTRGDDSLSFRLGDAAVWNYADVARLAEQPDADRTGRLVQAQGQLSLLPCPAGVDLDSYWATSGALTRFFNVAVADGGHQALAAPGYLDRVHAHVLAIPATVDGVRTALSWLATVDPRVWRRTVPVLVGRAPDSGLRPDATLRALGSGGAPATWLGYDRSLATGAALRPGQLSQQTVDAVLHIAGVTLTRACGERL